MSSDKKSLRNTALRIAALCTAALVAACGGLSDVGKQDNDSSPPFADAVILNHPFTKDGSGNVTARVRSGSEVFLSGKDSDGTVAPVLRFDWSVVTQGGVASQVKLITRNENTRSFTAPAVAQDTNLQFRLTVTDANGQTAQKDVNITIVAIPDADHFLSYNLDDLRKLKIVAATSRDVAPAEMHSGDVGFEITVRRLVDYTTPGVDGPYLELDSRVLTGKWLAAYGTGSACEAASNPNLQVGVPALDLDDILAKIDVRNPDLEPNPALVDSFNVKLQISIRLLAAADAPGSLPAGVTADVCAERVVPAAATGTLAQKVSRDGKRTFAKASGAADMVELNLADLIGPPDSTLDTLQSARAYYAAIDPAGERETFVDWLKVNQFLSPDRTSFSWRDLETSAGAHGVYTNNFDLGFGRDMYARIVRCDGATPQLGQPIAQAAIGSCDIAAVVVNYTSLEAASKKLNPVLIVAMEYSKPRGSDHRFVQFYTYAPDSVSGRFEQVMSANLDGRGEKYMPQVCTVCHGGTPGGLTAEGAYQNGGDLHATFLPWDLDAFLFADTAGRNADRSYGDDSLRQFYTRGAQAEPLRRLNQLAYLTYHDATRPNRFVLPQQLIEGWYGVQGASAFASTNFNGDYVPAGWTANGLDGVAGTADDNPADAPAIYQDVFARSCRMCHVAHMPATQASGSSLETLAVASGTFNTCDNELTRDGSGQVIEPSSIGVPRQAPFGCYEQFFNAPSLPQRLSAGLMPFARLTMDRFWVGDGSAPEPGGQVLFDHLAARYTAANDTVRLAALQAPGTPQAVALLTTVAPADLGSQVALDGTRSRFAGDFAWSLERCDNPTSLTPMCRSSTLPAPDPASLTCAAALEPLVGQQASLAGFQVQGTGFYRASLAVSNGASTTSALLGVTDWQPCAVQTGIADLGSATIGAPVSVNPEALFSRGNGPLAKHTLVASTSGLLNIAPSGCASAQGCAADSALTFTTTGVATNDVSVTLRDQDGEEQTITTRLAGTSSLSAANINQFTRSNAPISFNLLSANGNPAGVTFEVLTQTCPDGSVDNACLRNDAGTEAGLAVTATGFTYTPPPNFSTHDSSGGARFVAANRFLEQIRYRLVRTDNPNDFSAPGVVQIPLRALTTFANAAATWTGGDCVDCHVGSGPEDYLSSGNYSALRFGNLVTIATPKVNLANVSASGLLCYPLETCTTGHNGGTRSASELAAVRAWIESGANNY
jgi:mono/diheme cytochrome c family protein